MSHNPLVDNLAGLRDGLEQVIGQVRLTEQLQELLRGVARASHVLLTDTNVDRAVNEALAAIGPSAGFDVISVARRVRKSGSSVFERYTQWSRGGATPARAHALAIAAIRETFEETGLRLAASHAAPKRSRVQVWNEFGSLNCGPDLSKLDYIARAVTPPARTKRFNTRFFVADAETLEGDLKGSGELLDLKWVTISQALDLDIPLITERVLGYADTFLKNKPEPVASVPVPMFQMRYGKRIFAEE